MTIFDKNETVEPIAIQNFGYDKYNVHQCQLERVDVSGKCGLVCVEESENGTSHLKIVLEPVYNDIQVRKISTKKANYDRYAVFANGKKAGDFTMVLNEWRPLRNN